MHRLENTNYRVSTESNECTKLEKRNKQKTAGKLWLDMRITRKDLATYLPTYSELPKNIRERIDEATG